MGVTADNIVRYKVSPLTEIRHSLVQRQIAQTQIESCIHTDRDLVIRDFSGIYHQGTALVGGINRHVAKKKSYKHDEELIKNTE